MAALLLIVLAATLALLAQPSSASALDSYDIRATVRYGCATDGDDDADDVDDNFVEVSLRAEKWQDDRELVLQVGLAGPGSADSEVFPEGGPSLVTLNDDSSTKVRLAGPVHDGDHVFVRQLDQPEVVTLPLKATCHRIKPTDFGLDSPKVRVATRDCSPGAQANLKVTLDNPNDVDHRLRKMGIEQIDYTVLLVRHDGVLAGTEPVGTLVSFDEPSASVITLSQVVPKPATYQVRVIGLDGAVVSSDDIRLSCAGTERPGSSTPARPTPSVPTSPTKSGSPSTSRPAPSTSRPAPSSSHPAPSSSHPKPSSSHPKPTGASHRPPHRSTPASTAAPSRTVSAVPTSSVPVRVVTSTPAQRTPATSASSSQVGLPGPGATSSSPAGSDSAAPATSGPAPTPSATSSVIQLVEPRSGYRGVPVFQKDIALVMLAFCAGMAGLVGSSVVAARRR